MATYYSDQYQQAFVTVPSSKIAVGDVNGDVKHLAFNVTLTGAVALSEIIKLGKLPKGAKVIQTRLNVSDLGTTGVLNLGYAASVEKDQAGAVLVAADAVAIASGIDATAAVAATYETIVSVAAEVDLQLVATTATTAAGTISGYVLFVVN